MTALVKIKKGYIFNKSFNDENENFFELVDKLSSINQIIGLKRKPKSSDIDEDFETNLKKIIRFEIISKLNPKTYETENFLFLGRQYISSLFSSFEGETDFMTLDSNLFCDPDEEQILDQCFEELLKSEFLSKNLKNSKNWRKKVIIESNDEMW